MSGLPKGFGVGTAMGAPTKMCTEASKKAPQEKKGEGAPRPHKRPAPQRHVPPSTGEVPSKRQKAAESSSLVSVNLGSLADPFVKDSELKHWAGRSEKEVQTAMARASAELYYYTMTRLTAMSDQEARLAALEEEKLKLKAEMAALSADNVRLRGDLDAQAAASKKEVQTLQDLLLAKDASLADALADVQDLQGEVAAAKADQEKVKADAYTEGFRGYLKGFLAVDPDYDWTMFGESTVKWMEEFKVLEAGAIASRKAQIQAEQEKAGDTSGARPEAEDTLAKASTPVVP